MPNRQEWPKTSSSYSWRRTTPGRRPRRDANRVPDSEWVLREQGSGTRSIFEAAAVAAGVSDSLPVACELPSNEAVRRCRGRHGSDALSTSVAAHSIEAGLLVQVGSPLPDRAFTALRHRERHRSRAEEAFLDFIAIFRRAEQRYGPDRIAAHL